MWKRKPGPLTVIRVFVDNAVRNGPITALRWTFVPDDINRDVLKELAARAFHEYRQHTLKKFVQHAWDEYRVKESFVVIAGTDGFRDVIHLYEGNHFQARCPDVIEYDVYGPLGTLDVFINPFGAKDILRRGSRASGWSYEFLDPERNITYTVSYYASLAEAKALASKR